MGSEMCIRDRVWWACLENAKTDYRGHRHKSIAAEDRSKKYLPIGTKLELDVTKKQLYQSEYETDLDKQLIVLRSTESSPSSAADSLSSSSDPESYSES